jgi:hypothetical protein
MADFVTLSAAECVALQRVLTNLFGDPIRQSREVLRCLPHVDSNWAEDYRSACYKVGVAPHAVVSYDDGGFPDEPEPTCKGWRPDEKYAAEIFGSDFPELLKGYTLE